MRCERDGMTPSLFADVDEGPTQCQALGPGAVVLRRFAVAADSAIVTALQRIAAQAPFRHMVTPGGLRMSVAMTNCGTHGWVTDRTGYRYDSTDPESRQPWPPMPSVLRKLAQDAAAQGGFDGFEPDEAALRGGVL